MSSNRHVHFCLMLLDDASTVTSIASNCDRTPHPLYCRLRDELDAAFLQQVVPQFVALDALYRMRGGEELRVYFQRCGKYDTGADDIVVSLVEFIRRSSSHTLSQRVVRMDVLPKAITGLQAIAETLVDGELSQHHTLLRLVKDLLAFPGPLCRAKSERLAHMSTTLFPSMDVSALNCW